MSVQPIARCRCTHHPLVARRVCDLTNNKLKKLPAPLGRLSMLTSLTLESNHLKALPEQLCNLVRLEILSCGHNGLLSLPENIGALTKLKKLLLAGEPSRPKP